MDVAVPGPAGRGAVSGLWRGGRSGPGAVTGGSKEIRMHVYGPVPSRRLGRSLGVSLTPSKTCTYSCVYCQLGRTNRLQAHRESFFSKEAILHEILEQLKVTAPDFVTFCGDGEPTLSRDLGWLIRHAKAEGNTPAAVITNGSLLYRKDVRQDLEHCDVTIASLDAGDEHTFWKINRPHGTLDFGRVVRGLVEFRRECSGRLWIETMLVRGVNDSEASMRAIGDMLREIRPHKTQILTPIRPPAEAWVQGPRRAELDAARRLIENATSIEGPESGEFECAGTDGAREAIKQICSRHPLRLEQALEIEGELSEPGTVDAMLRAGDLVEVEYTGRVRFLKVPPNNG